MKSIIFSAVLCISLNANATVIELEAGNSVLIKAGDSATVTCNGDTSGGEVSTGILNSFCINGNELVVELDTDTASYTEKIPLNNSTVCKNTLSLFKNKMGEFSGVKTLLFCNGNELIKLRASSETAKIVKTSTFTANSTECQNAL